MICLSRSTSLLSRFMTPRITYRYRCDQYQDRLRPRRIMVAYTDSNLRPKTRNAETLPVAASIPRINQSVLLSTLCPTGILVERTARSRAGQVFGTVVLRVSIPLAAARSGVEAGVVEKKLMLGRWSENCDGCCVSRPRLLSSSERRGSPSGGKPYHSSASLRCSS